MGPINRWEQWELWENSFRRDVRVWVFGRNGVFSGGRSEGGRKWLWEEWLSEEVIGSKDEILLWEEVSVGRSDCWRNDCGRKVIVGTSDCRRKWVGAMMQFYCGRKWVWAIGKFCFVSVEELCGVSVGELSGEREGRVSSGWRPMDSRLSAGWMYIPSTTVVIRLECAGPHPKPQSHVRNNTSRLKSLVHVASYVSRYYLRDINPVEK